MNNSLHKIYPDIQMNQITVKFKVSEFQHVDFVIRANVKEQDVPKVVYFWHKLQNFTAESLVTYINTKIGLGFKAENFDYRRYHKITNKNKSN